MINCGKLDKTINIYSVEWLSDAEGFQSKAETLVLTCKAEVKTTKGYTLITSGTDFDKALTRFTLRKPSVTQITTDMLVVFQGVKYTILYVNNIDEKNEYIELQCQKVVH